MMNDPLFKSNLAEFDKDCTFSHCQGCPQLAKSQSSIAKSMQQAGMSLNREVINFTKKKKKARLNSAINQYMYLCVYVGSRNGRSCHRAFDPPKRPVCIIQGTYCIIYFIYFIMNHVFAGID